MLANTARIILKTLWWPEDLITGEIGGRAAFGMNVLFILIGQTSSEINAQYIHNSKKRPELSNAGARGLVRRELHLPRPFSLW
jgi:hypothetical protein